MSNKFKDIDIKSCTYYFFDDFINIKYFDPNKINIDEKSYKKNILIDCIGYLILKDSKYVKINRVNPLIVHILSKYLTLVPTNKSKGK